MKKAVTKSFIFTTLKKYPIPKWLGKKTIKIKYFYKSHSKSNGSCLFLKTTTDTGSTLKSLNRATKHHWIYIFASNEQEFACINMACHMHCCWHFWNAFSTTCVHIYCLVSVSEYQWIHFFFRDMNSMVHFCFIFTFIPNKFCQSISQLLFVPRQKKMMDYCHHPPRTLWSSIIKQEALLLKQLMLITNLYKNLYAFTMCNIQLSIVLLPLQHRNKYLS